MEKKFEFTGTGGQLFVKFLVGYLLTAITLGIYLSWFIVDLQKYIYANLKLGPTDKGDLKFEFTGTGGQLFGKLFVGGLLTFITFGIYFPWFIVAVFKFMAENSYAIAPDGTKYRLNFTGTGGDLFVTNLVGGLLCAITLFIYMPWYLVKLQKFFLKNLEIYQGQSKIGTIDFVGTGGDLFVTFLVGNLLTMITFGIYQCWFQVKLMKWFQSNTRVILGDTTFVGGFTGTGGDLFVLNLVGNLLTMLTLGIYAPWFVCKLWKWQYANTTFRDTSDEKTVIGAPSFS